MPDIDTRNIEDMLPEHKTGKKSDVDHSVTAGSISEAIAVFKLAKQRLQDINNWDKLCGDASADFRLTDVSGFPIQRELRIGDHVRINIPAPGSTAGEGYDWVQIEALEDRSDEQGEEEAFILRVRPATEPGKYSEDTAHFFKDSATSSFAVQRIGSTVTASVHGRNEVPNTDTQGILDKARNALVAIGAMIGLADPQWKSLVEGFLKKER